MGWWWWHSLHFAVLVGDRVVFSGSRWNRLCRLLRFTSLRFKNSAVLDGFFFNRGM